MSEQKTQAVQKAPANSLVDSVLNQVTLFQEGGQLNLPSDYSVANALKAAYLHLSDMVVNGKSVLDACTKPSIANALLKMATEGLSIAKRQGAFITYGDKLVWQREYQGDIALAMRYSGVKSVKAQIIYDGDEFDYQTTPDGRIEITKHKQDFKNIDNNKMTGAYAVVVEADGKTNATVMPMTLIRSSWSFGAMKGNSNAHKSTPDEMAKKTVIRRACKPYINSSDDSALLEGGDDEFKSASQNVIEQKANKTAITFDSHEEVAEQPKQIANNVTVDPAPEKQPAKQEAAATENASGRLPGF